MKLQNIYTGVTLKYCGNISPTKCDMLLKTNVSTEMWVCKKKKKKERRKRKKMRVCTEIDQEDTSPFIKSHPEKGWREEQEMGFLEGTSKTITAVTDTYIYSF